VNIEELQPISHGEFEMVLKDGQRSRVSKSIAHSLRSTWVNPCDAADRAIRSLNRQR
jgi:hypothetical protein